jgi:hypothetical protein
MAADTTVGSGRSNREDKNMAQPSEELKKRLAAQMAAGAAAKNRQREVEAPTRSKRYRHVWTQEQSGRTFGDGINTWAAIYVLSTTLTSTTLTCKVLIGTRNGTGNFTEEVAKNWAGAIQRVWSDKATVSVRETVGGQETTHTRRVLFEMGWNDANAQYQVTCNRTPGMAGLITDVEAIADVNARRRHLIAIKVPEDKAREYDAAWPLWKKEDALRNVNRDKKFHGTPDMLTWGDKDKEAVVHEFGHTIGLPDEYNVTQYNGANVDASIYNQAPFSTKSIMNNTVSSRGSTLYARHFKLIATDFKDLMRTTVKPTGTFTGDPVIAIL